MKKIERGETETSLGWEDGSYDRDKFRQRAGILFFLAASVIFMGIITGEIFYPDHLNYNTGRNDISDLGGTLPPEGLVTQPSAMIFNSAMIAGGLMLIGGAYFFHRAYRRRSASIPLFLFGLGALGVGIFPGNIAIWHPLFAIMTFFFGAIAAVTSSRIVSLPLGRIFLGLGLTSLFFLISNQAFIPLLGTGGAERWVAYPIVLWMLGLGGYLSGIGGKE